METPRIVPPQSHPRKTSVRWRPLQATVPAKTGMGGFSRYTDQGRNNLGYEHGRISYSEGGGGSWGFRGIWVREGGRLPHEVQVAGCKGWAGLLLSLSLRVRHEPGGGQALSPSHAPLLLLPGMAPPRSRRSSGSVDPFRGVFGGEMLSPSSAVLRRKSWRSTQQAAKAAQVAAARAPAAQLLWERRSRPGCHCEMEARARKPDHEG